MLKWLADYARATLSRFGVMMMELMGTAPAHIHKDLMSVSMSLLSYLHGFTRGRTRHASSAIGELQLRQGLENLSKSELAELLMEIVRDNDALYQKLRALVESIGDVR